MASVSLQDSCVSAHSTAISFCMFASHTQLVKHLPSKYKVLSSNLGTKKKKKPATKVYVLCGFTYIAYKKNNQSSVLGVSLVVILERGEQRGSSRV
jgi:hypothetical protein